MGGSADQPRTPPRRVPRGEGSSAVPGGWPQVHVLLHTGGTPVVCDSCSVPCLWCREQAARARPVEKTLAAPRVSPPLGRRSESHGDLLHERALWRAEGRLRSPGARSCQPVPGRARSLPTGRGARPPDRSPGRPPPGQSPRPLLGGRPTGPHRTGHRRGRARRGALVWAASRAPANPVPWTVFSRPRRACGRLRLRGPWAVRPRSCSRSGSRFVVASSHRKQFPPASSLGLRGVCAEGGGPRFSLGGLAWGPGHRSGPGSVPATPSAHFLSSVPRLRFPLRGVRG